MDYDEYWQKWLSLSVEVIVKNNIIKSNKQSGEPFEYNYAHVGQATAGFGE
jgi:hypothetical protein